KADQLVDRPHLAADRTHPLGRGLGGPRSKVEVGVSLGEHAAGISLAYAAGVSASAGSAGLARSASEIQPALTRACMIRCSASSREISMPSSAPVCLTGSLPSLRSVQPTRSSVAQPARSSI